MNEQHFETGNAPHIVIANCGDVTISGWKRSLTTIKGEGFTAVMDDQNRIQIASETRLTIAVPMAASVSVETAVGNVVVKHIDGTLKIGSCLGDVALNDVGQTVVDLAQGKINADNVNGRLVVRKLDQNGTFRNVQSIQIKQAGGDVAVDYAAGFVDLTAVAGFITLNTINGDVAIREGRGNAALRNLGGVNQAAIAGKLLLWGSLAHGEHRFSAKAGLEMDWPSDAPLRLAATASVIENYLPLAGRHETMTSEKTKLSGHIENGKAIVILESDGRMRLLDSATRAPSAELDVDRLIETAVSDALVAIGGQLIPVQAEQLKSPALAEELVDEIKEQLTAVGAPAQSPTPSQIAAEQAKQAVEQSLQQVEGMVVTGVGNKQELELTDEPETPVGKQETPAAPASGLQSRRHILQLLKDGLVTIDQADLLLDALDS